MLGSHNVKVAEMWTWCPGPEPRLSPLPSRLLWKEAKQWTVSIGAKPLTPPLDPLPSARRTHSSHARAWLPEQDAFLTADFSQLNKAIPNQLFL